MFDHSGMAIRAIELAKSTSLNSKALHHLGSFWGHLGSFGGTNMGPPRTPKGSRIPLRHLGTFGDQKDPGMAHPFQWRIAPFGHIKGYPLLGPLAGPFGGHLGDQKDPKRGSFRVIWGVGVLGEHVAVSTYGTDVTRSASGGGQIEVNFGSFLALKMGSFWGPIWGPKSGSFWGHFGSISGSQGRSQDLGVDLGISGWFWGHFGDIRGHYGTRVAGGPNTPFINNA